MPVLNGLLQNEGALVEASLGWSATGAQQRRAALRPVPPSLQLRALPDTGAEVSCVDAALIQQLGLPFVGFVPAHLPAHGGLLELPLTSIGYQALIGRDVLARCRFLYDGPRYAFRLTY